MILWLGNVAAQSIVVLEGLWIRYNFSISAKCDRIFMKVLKLDNRKSNKMIIFFIYSVGNEPIILIKRQLIYAQINNRLSFVCRY